MFGQHNACIVSAQTRRRKQHPARSSTHHICGAGSSPGGVPIRGRHTLEGLPCRAVSLAAGPRVQRPRHVVHQNVVWRTACSCKTQNSKHDGVTLRVHAALAAGQRCTGRVCCKNISARWRAGSHVKLLMLPQPQQPAQILELTIACSPQWDLPPSCTRCRDRNCGTSCSFRTGCTRCSTAGRRCKRCSLRAKSRPVPRWSSSQDTGCRMRQRWRPGSYQCGTVCTWTSLPGHSCQRRLRAWRPRSGLCGSACRAILNLFSAQGHLRRSLPCSSSHGWHSLAVAEALVYPCSGQR